MDPALNFFETHGYWLLFGLGFIEFVGLPIASIPLLLSAGALAAAGHLSLPVAVGSVATGGLAADSFWYVLGRWRGSALVDVACLLTSNPTACVLRVSEKAARFGGSYVLIAKFIPGAGNVIAPAAGLARLPALRFMAFDAAALLLWAIVYLGIGWVFSQQVGDIAARLESSRNGTLALVLFLIAGATVWRAARYRTHKHDHARPNQAPRPEGKESRPVASKGQRRRSGPPDRDAIFHRKEPAMSVAQPVLNTPGEGEIFEFGSGSSAELVVASGDAGGEYGVVRYRVRPGDEPPLHTHSREDEIVYVVDGDITATVGDAEVDVGAGAFAALPQGVPHTIRVNSDSATLILTFVPAGLERFFVPSSEEDSDPARFGIEFNEPAAEVI